MISMRHQLQFQLSGNSYILELFQDFQVTSNRFVKVCRVLWCIIRMNCSLDISNSRKPTLDGMLLIKFHLTTLHDQRTRILCFILLLNESFKTVIRFCPNAKFMFSLWTKVFTCQTHTSLGIQHSMKKNYSYLGAFLLNHTVTKKLFSRQIFKPICKIVYCLRFLFSLWFSALYIGGQINK